MKRLTAAIMVFLVASLFMLCRAQNGVPEGYEQIDSLIFTPISVVDSTLRGHNIWSAMPVNVAVEQSPDVRRAMTEQMARNEEKMYQGYRIRIFFDNSQNSRGASEAALYRFKTRYPEVAAYRTFANPFFKVTVGDYRTKSEALAALKDIKADFPSAFIVKEKFRYPEIHGRNSFTVDTLKIVRPLKTR